MTKEIKVKLQAEVICQYENFIVISFYLDGKFLKVETVDIDN